MARRNCGTTAGALASSLVASTAAAAARRRASSAAAPPRRRPRAPPDPTRRRACRGATTTTPASPTATTTASSAASLRRGAAPSDREAPRLGLRRPRKPLDRAHLVGKWEAGSGSGKWDVGSRSGKWGVGRSARAHLVFHRAALLPHVPPDDERRHLGARHRVARSRVVAEHGGGGSEKWGRGRGGGGDGGSGMIVTLSIAHPVCSSPCSRVDAPRKRWGMEQM